RAQGALIPFDVTVVAGDLVLHQPRRFGQAPPADVFRDRMADVDPEVEAANNLRVLVGERGLQESEQRKRVREVRVRRARNGREAWDSNHAIVGVVLRNGFALAARSTDQVLDLDVPE